MVSRQGVVTADDWPAARERPPLPRAPYGSADVQTQMRRALGEVRGKRVAKRFQEAARAFRAGRYLEARKLLIPIVRVCPGIADVRELFGLTLYRLGRFHDATPHLEAFRNLSGSVEQHPVLADCHRAQHRWSDVEVLWRELGAVSPSAALVTEGRIVRAGAMADRGEVARAIKTLGAGWRPPRRPRQHHLRRAYALADLYERAGRTPRARELFRWIANHDPDLADVSDRLRTVG